MHPRLFAGVLVAIAGLALAFVESLDLGSDDLAWAGALALLLSPLGASVGNVAIKLRAARLDAVVLNGWAMLGGGALLLIVSGATEPGASSPGPESRSGRSRTCRSWARRSRS